jgi:poly(A) polymerase Pap1
MDGDVQSYFSASHGLIVPPPTHSKPSYSDQSGFGGMGGSHTAGGGSEAHIGNNGQQKLARPISKPPLENYQKVNEDGFATWVSHNATIDEEPSNEAEELTSRVLENLLANDLEVYETTEQKRNKELVLIKLRDILDQWMQRVKKKHGIPPDSPTGNAKLLPYGSYKLGVSSPTGDIDTLVLAPYFVDRDEDFFGLLHGLLAELAVTNDNIKELTMVNQQHTIMPLIKMTFYDIPIDMVFARVQYTEDLNEFIRTKLYNEEYLQPMDEKMKRSFNGYRNAEMLLKSLARRPEESHLTSDVEIWLNMKREEVFRTTLKCIKLWAKNNGLDSNKMGYLGGISWALLTAKVCKLFPYKCPARLLEKFFWMYGTEWHWDEWFVRIEKEYPDEHLSHGRTMYIITPSRPQMNSTHNVTLSTLEIMTSRMRDSYALVKTMLDKYSHIEALNPTDPIAKNEWMALFTKYNFFDSYEHFIEINILGGKDADYLRWQGFVEAKIRLLCERFEDLLKFYDLKIHPWPNTYDRDKHTFKNYPFATTIYIGLHLNQANDDTIDLNIPVIRFIEYLENEWSRDNPARRDPLVYNISIFYKTRSEIPKEVLRAELELSEPAQSEAVNNKSNGGTEGNELREIQLSAHKSAMKDDFNQDLEPEVVDLQPAKSINSLNGLEMKSPRLTATISLPQAPPQIEEMDQEPINLYAQFDQAMRSKTIQDETLSKRSPRNNAVVFGDSIPTKSNKLTPSGPELSPISKDHKFHNTSEAQFLEPPQRNHLWKNLKPEAPEASGTDPVDQKSTAIHNELQD